MHVLTFGRSVIDRLRSVYCHTGNAHLVLPLASIVLLGSAAGLAAQVAHDQEVPQSERSTRKLLRPGMLESSLWLIDDDAERVAVRRIYERGGRVTVIDGHVEGGFLFFPFSRSGEVYGRTDYVNDDLRVVESLRHLQLLMIFVKNITDDGLKYLKGLTELEKLDLSMSGIAIDPEPAEKTCTLTGTGFKELVGLRKLRILRCWGPPISDDGLRAISRLPAIEQLRVFEAQVTDDGLVDLGQLTVLEILELPDTRVTDVGAKHIAEVETLRELDLSGTDITDVGVAELGKLDVLESLDLDRCNVTDACIGSLCRHKQLRNIGLIGTRVSQEGVAELRRVRPEIVVWWHGEASSGAGAGGEGGASKGARR